MTTEKFFDTMLALAEGKLSPDEWSRWWHAHDAEAETLINREEYLRIKPIAHGFRYVPILTSQKGAVRYLEENGVPFKLSSIYQENYRKELDNSVKESKKRAKELLNKLKLEYPELFAKYPKFSSSLKNAFCEGDRIEAGVTEDAISKASYKLPLDILAFFKTVSIIFLDGINISFSELRTETLCGKEYLVLGEFWKEADGDLVLVKLSDSIPTPIYYYCHSINKVKKLCASIDDLMEKKFSYYNNI